MVHKLLFFPILILLLTNCSFSQPKDKSSLSKHKLRDKKTNTLLGNNIEEFIHIYHGSVLDRVDDSVNFKHFVDNIYTGDSGKIYILTKCVNVSGWPDSIFQYEYFKDYTDFFDLTTYKKFDNWFFANKGKVYYWVSNDSWDYPIEIPGAEVKSFCPFKVVEGGVDSNHVFCKAYNDFKVIQGATPKTVKVLTLTNRPGVYFVDDKSVFYYLERINGADPKSFKRVGAETVDAMDKNRKYFEGKPVK